MSLVRDGGSPRAGSSTLCFGRVAPEALTEAASEVWRSGAFIAPESRLGVIQRRTPANRRLPGPHHCLRIVGSGASEMFSTYVVLPRSIYTRLLPIQTVILKPISTLTSTCEITRTKYHIFEAIQIKMPSATMTLGPQPISIQPISVPSSDVDFGAIIENVDLENLTGG